VTESEARRIVADAIARVAPEVDVERLDPTGELRDEADLDSMDFLHLVEVVSATIGREIPERDYARTETIDMFTAYLVETTR
jgi:acyl carrier protein